MIAKMDSSLYLEFDDFGVKTCKKFVKIEIVNTCYYLNNENCL